MHKLSKTLDAFSESVGFFCSWFVALMTFITCTVIVMRYGLNMGSVLLQDIVLYLHGALFLLGASFALKRNSHVRVDIIYRSLTDRTKGIIDLLGHLIFLQPLCWIVFFISWDFVGFSWKILEVSAEPDGLPFVYLQKTLLLILCVFLSLQSFSEIFKNIIKINDG